MPRVDVIARTKISTSPRVRQLESMFDVPRVDEAVVEWHGDVDLDFDWHVGLIVGPSGSGKTTLAYDLFPGRVDAPNVWQGASVIDDFPAGVSMQAIAEVCQAVGFNTIPAWLRPYRVLSTGEQFRVDLARRLLRDDDPIVVDEFTSVVDRQVAQIGAHAVQKYVRRQGKRFVAVSCHYDIVDWLQPDWILEPATMRLERRSVRPRPPLDVVVAPVDYAAWRVFAPFHYLTADLVRHADCFCLFVDTSTGLRPAAFAGVMHRPNARNRSVKGVSRLVTLPDWQGLGLAFVLADALGAAYTSCGFNLHTYPAHPALIRSFDRSRLWRMEKPPGYQRAVTRDKSTLSTPGALGARPCAVFRYVGPAMDRAEALPLIQYKKAGAT